MVPTSGSLGTLTVQRPLILKNLPLLLPLIGRTRFFGPIPLCYRYASALIR